MKILDLFLLDIVQDCFDFRFQSLAFLECDEAINSRAGKLSKFLSQLFILRLHLIQLVGQSRIDCAEIDDLVFKSLHLSGEG